VDPLAMRATLVPSAFETVMSLFTKESALDLFRLDQSIFDAGDFDALSRALVDWALEAGLDGAFVGRPDTHGRIRPGALSGQGMEAYLERMQIPVLDTCTEGLGPAGQAWRSRRVQVATLRNPADASHEPPTGEDIARWHVSATVPLFDTHECIGLFCLFSCDPEVLLEPQWATALSHIRLIAHVALDRLRLNAEQQKLRTLLMRDPLTALPKVSALAHHPNQAVPRANVPLVVSLLDLDKFKPVNDMFGHEAGDRILRVISHATRRRWRALLHSDALQMYCQPILDLKTGRVTKVEMLARLDEGSRLLTPPEFFPALTPEDFLELYVRGLRQTLSRRRSWLRGGVELAVSLNLPSSALLDNRYFEATREALETHDCPPHALMLELLETEALPLDADVSVELARFRSLGVALAQDDLGAGHSSLLRLRELPFDLIKIDRAIVNLAGQNASDVLSFIYQLTRLGHSLGKSVIVEGIESEALLEACAILNVDAVQGYAIARPMPAEELIEWIGAWPVLAARPDLPRTGVGKLAALLIWEERLHLIGNERNASGRLAEMVGMPAEASVISAAQSLPRSLCGDCELSRFFTGIDAVMSGAETEQGAAQALLRAAVTHGPRDASYRAARRGLISALTAGSLAAPA